MKNALKTLLRFPHRDPGHKAAHPSGVVQPGDAGVTSLRQALEGAPPERDRGSRKRVEVPDEEDESREKQAKKNEKKRAQKEKEEPEGRRERLREDPPEEEGPVTG